MEQHAFAWLDADRLTVPEHPPVDAEQLVAELEALGFLFRFLVGGPAHLLQRLDVGARERVDCHIPP